MSFVLGKMSKVLEKYKTILTKIEDFKNSDNRYIKIKIRTHDDKVYINFPGLNVSGDGIEC